MIRRTNQITRILIFAPVAVLGLLAPNSVSAEIEPGINITVYNNFGYNAAPPLPETSGRPEVGQTEVQNINQNFDQSPLFGMYEDFIVKYEGYITSPVSGYVSFWPHADDGTKFYLDGILIDDGNWVDKGGGGYQTEPQLLVAGVSQPFVYWYYENGGGANTVLYWDIGNGWEIVPTSAFTKQPVTPPTTTLAPYLNNPRNLSVSSTTQTKVSLTWEEPEPSNVDVERYAIFWSCDNWVTGFAISTTGTSGLIESLYPDEECSFRVRADNDTLSVYSSWSNEVAVRTLPTTTTTTTTSSTSTTSTTTTTIVPEEVSPWTTTTVLTPPVTALVIATSTTTITEKPVGTATSTIPVQTTVLQQAEQPQATTTTLPTKIEENISSEKATELATNPKVIASLNAEDAAQVFSAIDLDEITTEQAAQIVAAVQEAPEEVREAFEEEINVFGGKVDSYVPLGSTIPVGQRRVIVAIAAITAAVPVVPTRRS